MGRDAAVTFGPASPLFVSSDVPRAVAFYVNALGFELRFALPEDAPFFAIVGRGATQFLLKDPREDDAPLRALPNRELHPNAPWDAFVLVDNPDDLAAELAARPGAPAVQVGERDDGLRGFEVTDPDGHVLFLGRPA
mgnify:FL=1